MFAECDKHYPSRSGQTSLATAVTISPNLLQRLISIPVDTPNFGQNMYIIVQRPLEHKGIERHHRVKITDQKWPLRTLGLRGYQYCNMYIGKREMGGSTPSCWWVLVEDNFTLGSLRPRRHESVAVQPNTTILSKVPGGMPSGSAQVIDMLSWAGSSLTSHTPGKRKVKILTPPRFHCSLGTQKIEI